MRPSSLLLLLLLLIVVMIWGGGKRPPAWRQRRWQWGWGRRCRGNTRNGGGRKRGRGGLCLHISRRWGHPIPRPSSSSSDCRAQHFHGGADFCRPGGPKDIQPSTPHAAPARLQGEGLTAVVPIATQVLDGPLEAPPTSTPLGVDDAPIGYLQRAKLRPFLRHLMLMLMVLHALHLKAVADEGGAPTVHWTLIGGIAGDAGVEPPVDRAGLAVLVRVGGGRGLVRCGCGLRKTPTSSSRHVLLVLSSGRGVSVRSGRGW